VSAHTGRNELSENVKGRIKGIAKDVVNTEENNKLVSELKAKEVLKLEKGILILNMVLSVKAELFMMGEAQDIK
jgi:hypothetical protein